jgi:hypothetical protein
MSTSTLPLNGVAIVPPEPGPPAAAGRPYADKRLQEPSPPLPGDLTSRLSQRVLAFERRESPSAGSCWSKMRGSPPRMVPGNCRQVRVSGQRKPSEAARFTAAERDDTPSFM